MEILKEISDVDICSNCGSDRMVCVNSRNLLGYRRRNKQCRDCNFKIATIEVDERDLERIEGLLNFPDNKIKDYLKGLLNELGRLVDDGK